MKEKTVISLGGGRQSSFMLIKMLEGKFGIYPDAAIFADTQCEPDYVYRNLDSLAKECEQRFNFSIKIVSAGNLISDSLIKNSSGSFVRLYLPLFTSNPLGQIRRQCTLHYKIRPVRKAIRQMFGKVPIALNIGISYDEIERIRISDVAYIRNVYPLVDEKIRISDIFAFYKESGLLMPGKSSCIICPFHSTKFWRSLKETEPDNFFKACEYDNIIRNDPKMKGKMFLSRSLKPLSSMDLMNANSLYPELLDECSGFCGL